MYHTYARIYREGHNLYFPPSLRMHDSGVSIYIYIVIFVVCVCLCESVCVFVCVRMYR